MDKRKKGISRNKWCKEIKAMENKGIKLQEMRKCIDDKV